LLNFLLILGAVVCAIQALHSPRLISSALWLAATSAVLAIVLYGYGATQVAVIELSVGAGLVTVLFVFAINVAGEETVALSALVPRPLAWGLALAAMILLGWRALAAITPAAPAAGAQPTLADMLAQERGLDMLVQVALIFAGVLGLLGLLAESKPPLEGAAAGEMAARRERDLDALEAQVERGLAVPEEQS
jgi:uncharacterized MnhB-related membrane protein